MNGRAWNKGWRWSSPGARPLARSRAVRRGSRGCGPAARAPRATTLLVCPFDIVIASEDATFQDNTVAMGICGAEFFNHPSELGVRKAKEMLFTDR